jgi:hypothetical protein
MISDLKNIGPSLVGAGRMQSGESASSAERKITFNFVRLLSLKIIREIARSDLASIRAVFCNISRVFVRRPTFSTHHFSCPKATAA